MAATETTTEMSGGGWDGDAAIPCTTHAGSSMLPPDGTRMMTVVGYGWEVGPEGRTPKAPS